MILVVGRRDDVLCAEVVRRCSGRALLVDETRLFAATPFAYESAPGARWKGFLDFGDRKIALEDLSGALLRVTLDWAPVRAFDPSDSVFVMHETTAAWFELLQSLECPVVNRPSLAAWGHDPDLAEAVRDDLAARWRVPAGGTPGETWYATPETAHSTRARPDPGRLGALREWQREWGLDVCTVALATERDAVASVDPVPDFAEAPEPALRKIVDDVVGRLT